MVIWHINFNSIYQFMCTTHNRVCIQKDSCDGLVKNAITAVCIRLLHYRIFNALQETGPFEHHV